MRKLKSLNRVCRWSIPPQTAAGAGASLALPSGAAGSTQATKSSISGASTQTFVFVKWPTPGSANQGGIFLVSTAALIALAQGRASW